LPSKCAISAVFGPVQSFVSGYQQLTAWSNCSKKAGINCFKGATWCHGCHCDYHY